MRNVSHVRRRDSVLQPRSTNRQILPRTSGDSREPKKRRIASDEAVGELVEDGEMEAASTVPRRQRINATDRLDDLLAKPSPPKQVLSPLAQQIRQTRTPVTSGLAHQIEYSRQDEFVMLRTEQIRRTYGSRPSSSGSRGRESAESSRPSSKGSSLGASAGSLPPSSRTSIRGSAEPSRPTSKDTSIGSAERSRPSSRALIESPTHRSKWDLPPKRPPLTSTFFAKLSPRTPIEVTKPASRHSVGQGSTDSRRTRDSDASEWGIDPEQEPLRCRPVSRLKLGDFKVNPNYNQGCDYAFNDVVRGKTARQCLQGCTKPDCCGPQFRAMAEISHARGPPTLSQEEADMKLLEEYLGDNAYKIRNMSEEHKEELLLQAKTRDFANRYGKHRHAYERRTSPPGFWRADFPTTQEEMEDREKAKEIAGTEVEERYKEAMRPNGRFIFRDE